MRGVHTYVKGKIVDAWVNGLPVVTTPVGAEGMVPGVDQLWSSSTVPVPCSADGDGGGGGAEGGGGRKVGCSGTKQETAGGWGGRWSSTDAAGIARDAVVLHENRAEWERAQHAGRDLIAQLFPAERNLAVIRAAVEGLFSPAEAAAAGAGGGTQGGYPAGEHIAAAGGRWKGAQGTEGGERGERVGGDEAGGALYGHTAAGGGGGGGEAGGVPRMATTLEARRHADFFGATLWHHSARSTEYFSRWIEVKETLGDSSAHAPEGMPTPGALVVNQEHDV